VYKVLVEKPVGKRPLGRPRRRWEDGIRMDLGDWLGLGGGGWIGFSWLRMGTGGGLLWVRWWTLGFLCHGVSLHLKENNILLHYKDQLINSVYENNHCLHRESYKTYKYNMQHYWLLKQMVNIVTTCLQRIKNSTLIRTQSCVIMETYCLIKCMSVNFIWYTLRPETLKLWLRRFRSLALFLYTDHMSVQLREESQMHHSKVFW
jgi:hypothetical protein